MRQPAVLVLTAISLVATLVVAAPEDFSRPMAIYLKSGKRIIGSVVQEECTDQKLVIREIRGNVKRELKWSDLKPKQASELRIQLGFEVAEASAGMKLKGHEIVNRAGVKFTGLLINAGTAKRDGMYILKTAEGERRIRIADVRSGPDEVMIDALQVYKPQELYEQKLKEKPPETAEDHFKLAEFCAYLGALEPAKLHYEKVLEMKDKKYPETLIQRRLERVNKRLANVEAEDNLRDIKRAIVYNRFAKAAELLTAFKEKYKEDEDLMEAAGRLEADLTKERQEYYIALVPRLLRDKVKDLLEDKVKEPELTLRDAQNYAGGEPSDEDTVGYAALAAVGEKLGIKPSEVLDFWNLRSKRSIQKAFYRDGSFVVVENLQDALAKAPKPPKSKNAIKPPKPHGIKTPESWFNGKLKSRRYNHLRDWLYAWWAENSGMVELLPAKYEGCATCAGKGYTAGMHTSSQGSIPFFDRCQTCYMAKQFKVVRFK